MNQPGRPTLLVLMPAASTWAQMVVEFLQNSGITIHVADFNSELGTNPAIGAAAVESLSARVSSVRKLAVPGPFGWRLARGAVRLRRLARETGADAVLALYGGLQAAIACLSGVRPYVVYVVGSDILLADRTRRMISSLSLRRAAAVLSNGRYLAAQTREIVPSVPVEPLYFGIDLQRFRPPVTPVKTSRFVCTRVFHEVYDNAAIVRAVGAMTVFHPDLAVTFLSSGPLLQETRALADQTLEPALRARVEFAGGVSDEALVTALGSSRFYLSASRSDGASASLLEGMASGLFPIVSDIPANQEWIRHGENGLLFPPGDYRTLARLMEQAMTGGDWIDTAIQANLRVVGERADMHLNLIRLRQVLLRHCSPHTGGEAL